MDYELTYLYQGMINKDNGQPDGMGIMLEVGNNWSINIGHWRAGAKHGAFTTFGEFGNRIEQTFVRN